MLKRIGKDVKRSFDKVKVMAKNKSSSVTVLRYKLVVGGKN